ncbi:hypothetical protein SeLEV6574_g07904, partial [Synchytrium endobioticum]
PEFPISVTFEFVYGDNQARVEQWIRSRKEISLANLQKLAFTSSIKLPESIAETDLSFDVGDMGETTVSLCTNEDVQRNIWNICANGDRPVRLQIETQQRQFSDWKFSDIMELYNLSNDTYQALESFQCGITEISDEVRPTFNYLVEEIMASIKAFRTVNGSSEANRSEFISRILSCVTAQFDGRFELHPQMEVAGESGRGPVDWVIKHEDGRIIGVIEAKKSELNQGVAQNIIQLRSSMESNKPKKLDREETPSTVFGIVTTAEAWIVLKMERTGRVHKVYVHEGAPYVIDLSKNVDPKNLAAGLEEVFIRLLWIYEQSLPAKGKEL